VIASPVAKASADESRHEAVEAAVMWLRFSSSPPWYRRRFVSRMMAAAVFQQAAALGVVDCALCGDTGCAWCAS
jgi:hypothetical protein